MKCNRVNLDLTFSAALAGLLLSLAPSAAHGHGNNPKNTSDTAPDLGGGGGGGGPPPFDPSPTTGGGGGESSGSDTLFFGPSGGAALGLPLLDAITSSPDVLVFVGVDATLGDVLQRSLQVLFDPATVGTDFTLPADDAALRNIIDVDGFGIVDGTGAPGGLAPNVIPAPATLALLGLAAAAARRRRRRADT